MSVGMGIGASARICDLSAARRREYVWADVATHAGMAGGELYQ